MSTSFCENFSPQAILVQKLKKTTLDGAAENNKKNFKMCFLLFSETYILII